MNSLDALKRIDAMVAELRDCVKKYGQGTELTDGELDMIMRVTHDMNMALQTAERRTRIAGLTYTKFEHVVAQRAMCPSFARRLAGTIE